MRISVIIPFFNAEKTLGKAIASVLEQVGIRDLEVICINDGSTDDSPKIVAEYQQRNTKFPIHCIHQTNQGVSSARNAGLKIATGEYIAFLDADDVWHPGKTQILIEKMNQFQLDFIACRRHSQHLLFPYTVNTLGYAPVSFRQLLFRNEIQPSTVIFRKKIVEKVGYFPEGQRYAEDHFYWLIISKYYTMGIWDEQLILAGNGKRSFGEKGLSADLKSMAKGFQQNLKRLEQMKMISSLERWLYALFYRLKYVLLQLRKNL